MTGLPATEPRESARGLGAVGLASLGFSFGFIAVKAVGLPPPTVAFYRVLVGAVFLAALWAIFRLPRPASWGSLVWAGLCFGVHQCLFIAATQATSVAIVTLVAAMQPLLVAVVSHRLIGEHSSTALRGFAALAAVGVGLVVWANVDAESRSLYGDILSLLNLFAFTGYFLFSKRARQEGTHTVVLTATVLCVALTVTAPALALAAARNPSVPLVPFSGTQWGLIAFVSLGSGNGHLLVNWAHSRVSATLASLTLTTVPLFASLWAHLVFNEPFGVPHAIGMLLVAIAVEGGRRA